jgi:hypothetical protein
MSKKSILCIATSRNRAEQIIANLRTAHFASKDLSVVFPDHRVSREPEAEQDTKSGQWSVPSASVGAAQGGASAWYTELGTLVFADGERFTAAGPLLPALGGIAEGATNASMAASLIRLGVPVFEARQYESRLKGGNFLLAALIEDAGDLPRAKGVLSENYGENICIIDLLLVNQVLPVRHALMEG